MVTAFFALGGIMGFLTCRACGWLVLCLVLAAGCLEAAQTCVSVTVAMPDWGVWPKHMVNYGGYNSYGACASCGDSMFGVE